MCIDHRFYLFGGLGMGTLSDLSEATILNGKLSWRKVEYNSKRLEARQNHSAVAYKDCMYVFGGCYQFSSKVKKRECTN